LLFSSLLKIVVRSLKKGAIPLKKKNGLSSQATAKPRWMGSDAEEWTSLDS
jgi:hypothetical protein